MGGHPVLLLHAGHKSKKNGNKVGIFIGFRPQEKDISKSNLEFYAFVMMMARNGFDMDHTGQLLWLAFAAKGEKVIYAHSDKSATAAF